MYYIYGISGPSLLIESTDSMIKITKLMCVKFQPFWYQSYVNTNPIIIIDNNNNNVDSLSQGTASVLAGEVAALGDEAEAPRPEKKISLCM